MNHPSTLIVGAGGQLGRALTETFPLATAVDRAGLNIGDRDAVQRFSWEGISLIINAAGYTKVDEAETPEGGEEAWLTNAMGPANLAEIAISEGMKLVHVSSDYVFDGSGSLPHTEEEPFSPLGVYGRSKAAGDLEVSTVPKSYTVRTSWVIGNVGDVQSRNFVRVMQDLAKRGISPDVVDDQIGRLTFTSTLVDAIEFLVTTEAPYGTYNVTNEGPYTSWASLAADIFRLMGARGITSNPVTTAEYGEGKNLAPRPLNSRLSLTKLERAGFKPTTWRPELRKYVAAS